MMLVYWSACLPGSSCNESKMSIPAVGNVGFLRISGEEIAPVDTSNSHSTTVIGEDLNSVLYMFNQALQNAYDAGNWIHKCCATTHITLTLLKVLNNHATVAVMQYETTLTTLQRAPHKKTAVC